jgi:hypothetical protein
MQSVLKPQKSITCALALLAVFGLVLTTCLGFVSSSYANTPSEQEICKQKQKDISRAFRNMIRDRKLSKDQLNQATQTVRNDLGSLKNCSPDRIDRLTKDIKKQSEKVLKRRFKED